LSITVILSLVNIGSTAAFNSLLSLTNVAFFTCYFISIGCVLLKRLRGEPMPPSRFKIPNRVAIFCESVSLLYMAWAYVICFFPDAIPVTAVSMNWAVVVYFGVIILAALYYMFRGRKKYTPPVLHIRHFEDTKNW
jgi:amino acid transporter